MKLNFRNRFWLYIKSTIYILKYTQYLNKKMLTHFALKAQYGLMYLFRAQYGWFHCLRHSMDWFGCLRNTMDWFGCLRHSMDWFGCLRHSMDWFVCLRHSIDWFKAQFKAQYWLVCLWKVSFIYHVNNSNEKKIFLFGSGRSSSGLVLWSIFHQASIPYPSSIIMTTICSMFAIIYY